MGYDKRTTEADRVLAKKLDAIGWGLFFIWLGIAGIAGVGWGVGLVGVGVITLGVQAARQFHSLKLDGLGLALGFCFLIAGVFRVLDVQLDKTPFAAVIIPVVCIAVGLAYLWSVLRRRPTDQT